MRTVQAKAKRKSQKVSNMAKAKPKKSGPTPKNKALYSKVKSEAKRKFDVWPSAYASAWLTREYKKRGGTYG